MTDEKILALMCEDKEEGLAAAMSKYRRLVDSISSVMLTAREDREEVAADTFYKVWAHCREIDLSRGSLKNYICTVAHNLTINKLRNVSRAETLSDEERDIGIEVDFSNEISAEHNRIIIAECIRSMPSPDREMFVYRYYYNMPVSLIAEKTGTEERRVEYILHRCKRSLRDALTKGGILL